MLTLRVDGSAVADTRTLSCIGVLSMLARRVDGSAVADNRGALIIGGNAADDLLLDIGRRCFEALRFICVT